MKELIEVILKHLVDYPDEVHVNEITGTNLTVFELKVAQSDIGKVLGRGGQNIHALRHITRAAADHDGRQVLIEVLET